MVPQSRNALLVESPLVDASAPSKLALIGLLLLATPPVSGQQYHIRQYTVEEGLPSAHVRSITQDSAGRIWFATRSGIASYDGLEWTTYNLADGLTWADQFALQWDSRGTLWSVGVISPFKIFHLREDREANRWQELPGPRGLEDESEITAFAVRGTGHQGTLALGTAASGVLLRHDGAWRRLSTEEGLPSVRIRGIVTHGDDLIVATPGGLVAIRNGEVDPEPFPELPADRRAISGMAVEAAAADETPRLWILGGDWIGLLGSGEEFTLLADDLSIKSSDSATMEVQPDRRGGLYFGSEAVLYYFHPDAGLEPIGRANGLLADGVTALFLDREDNLWVGTERGVSKLISRQLARWGRSQGLFDDGVTAVLERDGGDIVLGHRGGLSLLSGPEIRTLPLPGPGAESGSSRPERVSDLTEDAAGNLWMAAGTLGLGRLDPAGRIRWYGADDGLAGSVTAVLHDSRGRLWAATEGELRVLADGSFEPASIKAPRIRIRRIFEATGGALYLAASSGLYRFADDGWRTWTCDEATACNSVFAMLEAPEGVFAGTSAGLHRATGEALMPQVAPVPRIERPIYFMVRDTESRIWFGTDNGVLRWDGTHLDHFTIEDGLAGRETNRAAGMVDSRGRVWIGTESGVTVYSDARPGPPRGPPLVSLTGVDTGDRLMPLTAPLRFRHDENDLTFRFRAVSLLDEDRILISSRLEGFEADWSEPDKSPDRELRYTNLAPGRYVLHLKAANAEGTWSATVSSAQLTIANPFWRQAWFLFAAAIALGAAIYGVSRHYAQRRYSRRLEAEVAERVSQLMTEKERLSLTLRNIDDGLIATDERGEIVLLNPTAEEITSWSSGDAVGLPLERVLRLHQTAPAGGLGQRLVLPGPDQLERFEQMGNADLITRRGDRRLVELSGSPILRASGHYTGMVLAFRDITEKTQLESELAKGQKLEALGLLAGGIAHDFNNLLTVLLGNLSLLGSTDLPESRRGRFMEDAENAVMRAKDLTHQLLTFSLGGDPVRMAASISEVIRDSASFVMSGSNVLCEIDLPPELWVVEIDAGQISQVVNNLLINAIQSMPDGGTVRIVGRNTTETTPALPAGKYIAIDVVDHGIGIPSSHQARVFDPYFSTKQEGRGLGLASAYSIARKHEGLLTVESRPGEGTTFTLFLPASKSQVRPSVAGLPISISAGGRILIMDDEDAVRHVTGSIVEQLGYEATLAADGREAIDRYRQALDREQPYDAVIMDLTIPGGMGGREAIDHLRGLDPSVRAVVMSGYSNDPVLSSYRDYGFRGVIGKPFKADDLARVLGEVLTEQTTHSTGGTS